MEVAEFNQRFQIRSPNLMWLLGAGASAAANIPTAGQLIWDFKRRLFCASQRVPLSTCQDAGDPVLRKRLQDHFAGRGGFPAEGADDEYAAFFEAVFPDDGDRRRYIQGVVEGGKPSYGHNVLAVLMAMVKAQVIWTPNFDRVVEDAAAMAFGGTSRMAVASIDAPGIALDCLNEARFPLLGKLHGDFHSRRLKNTSSELRQQDAQMREAVVRASGRFGLVVMGYSGRDGSIMSTLEEAATSKGAFPAGLFWFHRADSPPSDRIQRLISTARDNGVDAHLLNVETFDELMGDLALLLEGVPKQLQPLLDRKPTRVADVPVASPGNSFPVIRLNALHVVAPSLCRRVDCGIGGTRQIVEVIKAAGSDVIAIRKNVGVLAFGRDAELKRIFEPFGITGLDFQSIDNKRLRYSDSTELGMLTDALAGAIRRERPVASKRRRGHFVLTPLEDALNDPRFGPLRQATGGLSGIVEGTSLPWSEGVRVRLEFRLNDLWILLDPTVAFGEPADDATLDLAKAFVRERRAKRRNREANAILDSWIHFLTDGQSTVRLRSFGITQSEGTDAEFSIHQRTLFSRRAGG